MIKKNIVMTENVLENFFSNLSTNGSNRYAMTPEIKNGVIIGANKYINHPNMMAEKIISHFRESDTIKVRCDTCSGYFRLLQEHVQNL